jgi:hypothetical protein
VNHCPNGKPPPPPPPPPTTTTEIVINELELHYIGTVFRSLFLPIGTGLLLLYTPFPVVSASLVSRVPTLSHKIGKICKEKCTKKLLTRRFARFCRSVVFVASCIVNGGYWARLRM